MLRLKIRARGLRGKVSKFLKLTRGILNDSIPSDREIDVLTEILMLPSERYRYSRFSRVARKKVVESVNRVHGLSMKVSALNAIIYSLLGKGYLWRDEDGVIYVQDSIENVVKYLTGRDEITLKFEDSEKVQSGHKEDVKGDGVLRESNKEGS